VKLLVIGGGQFFGASLVDLAVAAGHTVTVVQRGRTSRPAPEGVELLTGDREHDLPTLLAGRSFDAVVDTCGYLPRIVGYATDLLRDAVGRYCFISSVSAYEQTAEGGYTEDVSPLDAKVPAGDEYDPAFYGGLKASCESVVLGTFGERGLVVRPGLIVGPRDHTDRFAYWPRRFAEGGRVLGPVGPDYAFQVIDARDLAQFVLTLLADGRPGVVNAVGPERTFADLVATCAPDADVVYAGDVFLQEHEVVPFLELPLWIPADSSLLASDERAIAWGLTTRPLAATVADTLAWDRERGLPPMANALSREKEARLLAEL
jgi:2'-hydroxyisoflavone reductase